MKTSISVLTILDIIKLIWAVTEPCYSLDVYFFMKFYVSKSLINAFFFSFD